MNYGNYDSAEVIEEFDKDDDISYLLRNLAVGLIDRGDFDDNNSSTTL